VSVWWRPLGCVLWLDFAEPDGARAYDQSGQGNHGVIYGAVRRRGPLLRALSFDGVDDRVEVPYSPTLPTNGEIFSVLFWINPLSLTDLTFAVHHEGWAYFPAIQPGGAAVRLHRDDGSLLWFGDYSYTFEAGQWYLLGQAYDGSTDYLILNGQLIPVSLPEAVATRSVANPRVAIGYRYYDAIYTDRCIVALARIYSRVLTEREIVAHYWHLKSAVLEAP